MKNVIRIALVVFAFLFASLSGGVAQKTAHVNGNEVLGLMAQKDSVGAKLEKLQAELTKELDRLQVEYNRLLEDYNTNQAGWTDLVRRSKEADLVRMQEKIPDFREGAIENLSNKEKELMAPIQEKVLNAISEVAKAQGITYVLNTQALLYVATDAVDLGPAVKTKLGLK